MCVYLVLLLNLITRISLDDLQVVFPGLRANGTEGCVHCLYVHVIVRTVREVRRKYSVGRLVHLYVNICNSFIHCREIADAICPTPVDNDSCAAPALVVPSSKENMPIACLPEFSLGKRGLYRPSRQACAGRPAEGQVL